MLVWTLVGGWCKGRSNFCSDLQTFYENIFYFSEMSSCLQTRKKNCPLRTWQICKRNRDMYIISYILMNQNIHCIGKKVMFNIEIFPNFCLICGLIWTFNAQYSCFMGHLGHELQFKIANSSPKSGSIPYFLYKKIHTYLTFILLSWYFSTFENKNDYLYKVCEFSF